MFLTILVVAAALLLGGCATTKTLETARELARQGKPTQIVNVVRDELSLVVWIYVSSRHDLDFMYWDDAEYFTKSTYGVRFEGLIIDRDIYPFKSWKRPLDDREDAHLVGQMWSMREGLTPYDVNMLSIQIDVPNEKR